MARFRFSSAQEVFDAFPTMADDMTALPAPSAPPAFVRALLASQTPEDAVTFCAYALGRREAVWWGAGSVRLCLQIAPGQEDAALRAAEHWVREPEDDRRRAALKLGMTTDRRRATAWLALGAGWSGGNISPDEHGTIAAAPHMTAQAVRTAILVALARVNARERAGRLATCAQQGVRLMQDGGRPP